MSLNFGRDILCVQIFLILVFITAQNELRQYNVALLMVERSSTIRFDLEHIGPAIDIAIQVNLNFFSLQLYQQNISFLYLYYTKSAHPSI
jgi:hypothetical protein